LWGFFKKLVIADNLAGLVSAVYDGDASSNGLAALIATYAFAVQIYCDFSGYSDIARGAAKLLDIDVMQNFDSPYESRSIAEFWRRWHVALSTWLRDYVFTPLSLGGGRSRARGYASVLITFTVSGLWHGAGWTFVAWGLLHGVYIAVGIASRPWRDRRWGSWARSRTRDWLARFVTFHLVCVGWVLFRSPSLDRALDLLTRIAIELPRDVVARLSGHAAFSAFGSFSRWELAALVAGSVSVLLAEKAAREPRIAKWLLGAPGGRLALYALILYSIVFLGNFGETAFIYSQF
jgi:D-alanyl-lipoteichoic acid acyltransferase DltB (MBOAT superfamily)